MAAGERASEGGRPPAERGAMRMTCTVLVLAIFYDDFYFAPPRRTTTTRRAAGARSTTSTVARQRAARWLVAAGAGGSRARIILYPAKKFTYIFLISFSTRLAQGVCLYGGGVSLFWSVKKMCVECGRPPARRAARSGGSRAAVRHAAP